MKIISLNIFDLPLWFVKDRKARLHAIQHYLNGLNADIICLQESFDPDHRVQLNDFFKTNGYYTTGNKVERRRVLGVPMDTTGGCVIFSKFPITSHVFVPFEFILFSPAESAARKGSLIADVETPYGVLRVVNIHLCQRSLLFEKATRLRQMRRVLEYLAAQRVVPTVIAGDLNEHDVCKNRNFSALMDAHAFTHPQTHAFHPTYRKENPYMNIWMNKIPHSKRIDYIMHNNLSALGLKSEQYSVLYPEYALSDHDPVVVMLENV